MQTVELSREAALGEGTRPKGFVLGQVDQLANTTTIVPAEGVSVREIQCALRNGLCRRATPEPSAVEEPEPAAVTEQTPSPATSTPKKKGLTNG